MAARSNTAAESTADRELVVTRVFDAPRELVWKTLTVPEHLEHWWGPKGITSRVHKLELRPGGTFYTARKRRTAARCGANGSIAKSSRRSGWCSSLRLPTEGQPDPPSVSAELAARDPGHVDVHRGSWPTAVTVRMVPINATASEEQTFFDGSKFMEEGFAGTWDKLDKYLATL